MARHAQLMGSAVRLTFLFIILATLVPPARADEPSPLATALGLYSQGRAEDARPFAEEAFREASTPQEQFALAQTLQDLCFQAYQGPCVTENGLRLTRLLQGLGDDPAIPPATKAAYAADLVTRHLAQSFMAHDADLSQRIADQLSRINPPPQQLADPENRAIQLAWERINRGDLVAGARHAQAGWVLFLARPGQSEARLLARSAEFIDLFRATGQNQRAAAILALLGSRLNQAAPATYASFRLRGSQYNVLADLNDLPGALASIEAARQQLRTLQFPPPVARQLTLRVLAAQVILCSLRPDAAICSGPYGAAHGTPQATLAETLGQEFARLPPPAPGEDPGYAYTLRSEAAVALALAAVGRGQAIPAGAVALLETPPPPDTPNFATLSRRTVYLAGRYLLAQSRGEAGARAYLMDAAHTELTRLASADRLAPFNATPINLYTRTIFTLAARQLAGQATRSADEEQMLFAMANHLNRSLRSVQSQYLAERARQPDAAARAAFQTRYRAQQARFQAEKEAYQALLDAPAQGDHPPLQEDILNRLTQAHDTPDAEPAPPAPLALLPRTQAALSPDERFITGFPAGDRFIRLCLGPAGLSTQLIPYDAGAARVSQKLLAAALTNPSPPNLAQDAQFPLTHSQALSRLLVGEDDRCLGKARHLIFALPEEFLGLSPLVLLDPSPGSAPAVPDSARQGPFRQVNWLGLSRAITLNLDAREFLATRSLQPGESSPRALLALGDPLLSGNTEDGLPRLAAALRGPRRGTPAGKTPWVQPPGGERRAGPLAQAEGASTDTPDTSDTLPDLQVLPPLPDTTRELKTLASALGKDSDLLLGEAASEGALRRRPLQSYRVLAFATHGLLREELPGIREAALVLTPRDSRNPADDGLLTASEIARLDLNAELVLLSACNSANFDLSRFGPEAASLSSAFFLAGARSTVAALWSVNSAATSRLMEGFARARGQDEKTQTGMGGAAEELRLAIHHALATAPNDAYRHPRFWAAFAVYGAGRPGVTNAP